MDINEDGYLTEEDFVACCLQDDLLLHNMLLHRHYLANGGNHYFRSVLSKSNLKKYQKLKKNLRDPCGQKAKKLAPSRPPWAISSLMGTVDQIPDFSIPLDGAEDFFRKRILSPGGLNP